MTLANPKNVINYYVAQTGTAVPASSGVRPVGPTPARAFPLTPYQAPVQAIEPEVIPRASGVPRRPLLSAPVHAAETVNIHPSGEPIAMNGRPLPAVRPSTTPVGVAERGFNMGGGSFSSAGRGVRATGAPKQIGYTEPIRTMPNARGLRATTEFGRGATASTTENVVPKVATAAKAGLRGVLRGVGGAVLTDMLLPESVGAFDDAAAVKNWKPAPAAPRGPSPEAQKLNSLSRMSDGTFPGQAAFVASQGVRPAAPKAPAPRPVSGSVRRAAAPPPLPAWTQVPSEPVETPTEAAAPQEQQANPMIRELPVEGAQFDAQGAVIPGANGGFGLTRNADGTISQMFTLRERTAAEDAANPRVTQDPPTAGIRLRPGDVGYTGSQQAWEDQQAASQMLSNPFPFKTAAALLAQRAQGETEANNLRNFGINAAQTAANVQHLGTEDQKIGAEIPWIAPQAAAGIRQTVASANNLTASAGKTAAEIPYVGPQAEADIKYKNDLGLGVRTNAEIARAELPARLGLLGSETKKNLKIVDSTPDKNQIAADANATRQRAQDEVEMKTYAANDTDFLKKFGAIGSSLPKYKAAELIAQHYGLTYKTKPFKSGFPGFRTEHKAGWYTADGQEAPMDKMVEEYLKTQGGK